MNSQLFKKVYKTRTFRLLFILLIVYLAIVAIFILFIEPDKEKTPGGFLNLGRDLIWIIGWRYYLDWPMIIGYFGTNMILCMLLKRFSMKLSTERLSSYVVPFLIMLSNAFYMLVVDIAITFFADVYLAGNWESQEIIFLGMTAQRLYHGFFFWFGPNILFMALIGNSYLKTMRYRTALKTFCVCIAIQFFTLGFLDAIVCHYLWGDWQAFGNWSMGGDDPMWAVGWISHYIILGTIWSCGIIAINQIIRELER